MDGFDEELKCVNCEISLPFKKEDYIRCVDTSCKQENVVLCAKCFAMGAECGTHTRSHPYQVETAGKMIIMPSKSGSRQWSTEEDEQLIALAAQYKCGAWDEVAKAIGRNISAKEAMLRFDEHFIRGPMGRHAGSNKCWPFIDDRTGALCTNHDIKGRQATGPSEWQYIVEGIREWNEEVNLDDFSWKEKVRKKFQQFKEDYEQKKTVVPVLAETSTANGTCGKTYVQSNMNNMFAISPIKVKFLQANSAVGKRNKRIVSSSSEDIEPNVMKRKWSDTESNESAEIGVGPSISRREILSPRKRSFVPLGMQSSDEEELDETLFSDEKDDKKGNAICETRSQSKKRGRKPRSVRLDKKEDTKDGITIRMEEEDKIRLRSAMPFAFFNIQQSLPGTSAETLKAKSDDLQLLGYWPGRDDYDIEQNNDAERLISQIVINPATTFDEQFDNAVKMANIRCYNLILAARNASKMMIREHGLVDLFFDKILNLENDGKYRGYVYNKQYHAKQRFRKQYADLLKPVHQVTLGSEMEELVDSLAARDTLSERVKELQKLKEAGMTILPGHLKGDLDNVKIIKRKRKTYNNLKRKGILKYERLKRWTQKHAESDD